MTPPTATTTTARWSPPSRRAQWAGAVGILLVAGFWGLLVPLVNDQVEGSNPFRAGRPYEVGGATIVPADGWQLGDGIEGVLTSIEHGSTSVGVLPATESTDAVEDRLLAGVAALEADTTTEWQIGEPELFTTEDGTPAGRIVSHSPNEADVTYVISDGTRTVTLATRTDQASWLLLKDEVDAMARSVVLVAPAAGAVIP